MGKRGVRQSMSPSLCETCIHKQELISGTGSRFLLCTLSRIDGRFSKYPPQPVIRCEGHADGPSPTDSPGKSL